MKRETNVQTGTLSPYDYPSTYPPRACQIATDITLCHS